MPRVTCYGGVGEIGGNKFLLEDADTRLFLDMGQNFHYLDDYFVDPWLMPRQRFGLRDLLRLGLIPRIPGLFAESVLEGTDLRWQEPAFDGILLSHCHFDHLAHLAYVDPAIPVYLGETALTIIQAWEATSGRINFGEHDYRPFRTGDTIRISGVEVEPIHVDHSVPGAYGFLVRTSGGTLVYTGDLRQHGPHAEMTEDFLQAAEAERPAALLTEGTRMVEEETRRDYSEEQVQQGATRIIQRAGVRLVTVTFYPRDIDRMRTFYLAATEAGREFLTSSRTAFLLRALEADPRLSFPKVFRDYEAKAYFREKKEYRWERDLREELGDRAVDAAYVNAHPEEIVLQVDFPHLAELVDIAPAEGGHFIHSKSEPFEEDDLEDAVLRNWLEAFQLDHHQLHASGHASRGELEAMIGRMQPQKVIPIHTEHPELFVPLAEDVALPEVGTPIEF